MLSAISLARADVEAMNSSPVSLLCLLDPINSDAREPVLTCWCAEYVRTNTS